jgi:glycosyltransferase involved in cell wall biosynthesis
MKVLVVSFYYPPEMGAAASRISNMAEGLKKENADVDVLTCLPSYPLGRIFEGYRGCLFRKEQMNGINTYRYWTYATVSKNPTARLASMLVFSIAIWLFGLKWRTIRSYDRIVIQSPPLPVAFSAMLLFKCLYRKTSVLNVSDLWPLSAVELGAVKKGSTYYNIMARMERFIYRKADAFQCQSQEIIDHIKSFGYQKPCFLYRNLQPQSVAAQNTKTLSQPLKLVYAGLLGVAQDILGMIQQIDFKALGAELHIFGGGNQANDITAYAESHDCGVICHGYQSKQDINRILGSFHASVVPLTVPIKGAVPSKIYDILPHGVPIIFCGGGEGERIVREHHLGFVSAPSDYESLKTSILRLKNLTEQEYQDLRNCCLEAATSVFSFSRQMENYKSFLESLEN